MTVDAIKSLLDSAKATTYELLALLLPGAMVLAALSAAFAFEPPFGTVGAIAAAYILGTAQQAIADYGLKRAWIAKRIATEATWKAGRDYALGIIQRKLTAAPSEVTLDVCLTHVGAKRNVYDKFIALRDMSRGLAVATAVTSVVLVYDQWQALTSGSWWFVAAKVAGVVAVSITLFAAFLQRYARFCPLALQAVFGQFISMRLDAAD